MQNKSYIILIGSILRYIGFVINLLLFFLNSHLITVSLEEFCLNNMVWHFN